VTLDGRTLDNAGAAVWNAPGSTFVVTDGAVVDNQAGGTFNVQGDLSIGEGSGTLGTFSNAGTLTKSAGTANSVLVCPFNSSGTVQIQSGTLSLARGGDSPGSFTVSAGAALGLGYNDSSGTQTLWRCVEDNQCHRF